MKMSHQLGLFLLLSLSLCSCNAERPISNYYEAKQIFWSELYAQGGETIYCAQKFSSKHPKSINVEHVLPMGWVMRTLKCGDRKNCRRSSNRFNRIEADLHNLYPARANINRERSSYAFAQIKGEKRRYGKCDVEIDHKKRRIEPREEVRGDIARSVLYMSEKYNIELFKKQRRLLEQWHRDDPPDTEEKQRNAMIFLLQGSSNHFIEK